MGKAIAPISTLKQWEIHSPKLEEEIQLLAWTGGHIHRTTKSIWKINTLILESEWFIHRNIVNARKWLPQLSAWENNPDLCVRRERISAWGWEIIEEWSHPVFPTHVRVKESAGGVCVWERTDSPTTHHYPAITSQLTTDIFNLVVDWLRQGKVSKSKGWVTTKWV